MYKQKKGFIIGISCLTIIVGIRAFELIGQDKLQKLIIYNVPKHRAIDIIDGRKYQFIGDSTLMEDSFLQNFHLKPSRILQHIELADNLKNIVYDYNVISSSQGNIILLDSPISYLFFSKKIKVNAIIISGNPKIYISQLANLFDCNQYIFDASNPLWKINKWKKDCENLHLRHYSIPEQGAFEMEL
jgi:competence protein ComEC